MPRTLVSLGSNLGEASAALDAAIEGLTKIATAGAISVSDYFTTNPIGGPPGQGVFLNAAATLDCDLQPRQVLAALQAIEQSMDRERHARWAARTLDVDLLLYDGAVIDEPTLRVPHPRMSFRPFVLEPAVQVAGEWRHPEGGQTLAQLLDQLRNGADAVLLVGDDGTARRWIGEDRGVTIRIVEDAAEVSAPRLTIDARRAGSVTPIEGPRLALADCAEEHRRDEVIAAVECVWPRDVSISPRFKLAPGQ